MYERIARWYNMGLWKREMVDAALAKGLLTQTQHENILQ